MPRLGQAAHLSCVEFAEVDGLGDVAVGLGPRLAAFEHFPRRQLETAIAHDPGRLDQDGRALLGRCRRPGGERLAGRGDGRFRVIDVGQRDLPHDPRAVARVDGIEPAALGVNLVAADREGIRSPELQAH